MLKKLKSILNPKQKHFFNFVGSVESINYVSFLTKPLITQVSSPTP
jgi:hypothetical protein